MAATVAIPPHSYTPEQRAKERRYLERIGNLMGDGPNYQKVVKYVENSQCHEDVRLEVVNIHRVWRRGDPNDFYQIPNRMLLWHGTMRTNIPRILDTGFVLPSSTGQMFGTGIYFADRITKSTNYTDLDNAFLLLCEVSLGKQYSCKRAHNTWTSPPIGFDSVKGNGTYVPDWTDFDYYMGSRIPSGKTARCTKYPTHAVNFNEFIVYDPSRIIIRFLVEVTVQFLDPPIPMSLVIPSSRKRKPAKHTEVMSIPAAATTQQQLPASQPYQSTVAQLRSLVHQNQSTATNIPSTQVSQNSPRKTQCCRCAIL